MIFGQLLFILNILVVVVLVGFVFSPLFLGVPFLPTHRKQARKMLELAEIKPGMKVIDLGSGAGRLLFLAESFGATAIGYELNPFLVLWTRLVIRILGKQNKIKVLYKSIYDADIADADVIVMFLYPPHMKKLTEKLKEIKSTAKILSYTFSLPGWTPVAHEGGVYLYKK